MEKKEFVAPFALGIVVGVAILAAVVFLYSAPPEVPPVEPPVGPPVTPPVTPAVCGNAVAEEGETFATCCEDAGCPAGYSCQDSACVVQQVVYGASFATPFWMGPGDVADVEGFTTITANSESSFTVAWPDGSATTESITPGESATHAYTTVQVNSLQSGKASLIVTRALAEKAPGEFINLVPGQGALVTGTGFIVGLKSLGDTATIEIITVGEGSEEAELTQDNPLPFGEFTIQLVAIRDNGSAMLLVASVV